MALTYSFADLTINAIRGGNSLSYADLYLALLTQDPTRNGYLYGEPSTGGYVRQAIALGTPLLGAASNTTSVAFGPATSSWGTITHVALLYSTTGAGMVAYEAITNFTMAAGASARFDVGELTFSLV